MPRICEFFGVIIYMYYNDHRPPHFHAEYAEHEALFAIDTLKSWTANFLAVRVLLSWSGPRSIGRHSAPTGSEQDRVCPSMALNP